MIEVTVAYPAGQGRTFNMDYYLKTHIPLFQKRMGTAMKTIRVSRGIGVGTRSIRAGSRGNMMLNHAPLIIAEQFETLETLYPRRIDLGLGRTPESDMLTSRALRRAMETDASTLAYACWNFYVIPKMW